MHDTDAIPVIRETVNRRPVMIVDSQHRAYQVYDIAAHARGATVMLLSADHGTWSDLDLTRDECRILARMCRYNPARWHRIV